MHYLDETHIGLFLVQVFVLLLLTRGVGELFYRHKQPALTAEILIGVLLGPTILGRLFPSIHQIIFPADPVQQNMLETMAWIGVLFLLLDTGLEIDFSVAWRQRGSALIIALSDIVIPMIIAFIPCVFLPSRYLADPGLRYLFAAFMAVVMTISAMPVAARVLHELNLLKTDLGFLIMAALAVNDIIGWVLFTIILGLFAQAAFAPGPVLLVFSFTVGFTSLALIFGRSLSARALGTLQRQGLPEPSTSLTFACLLGLLFGSITHGIGIHALFGFFIAGVVIGEAKNLSEETRRIISQMVHALFVPIFFANVGLKIDFIANFDVFLVGLVCVIGILGRYAGAWFGVSWTNVPRMNRHLIAIAHTPGGMMEVVVALMALEAGLITPQVFVAIVFSAVFSSMVMGPWMRNAMDRRATTRLIDYLVPETVVFPLTSKSREDAIRELAARLALKTGRVSAEEMARAAIAREQDFGTGLGKGMAIPHVRLDGIPEPVLAFGKTQRGLDWNAPDGAPVRHIFFLATPTGAHDMHMQILSQVAKIMHSTANRALVDEAEDSAALWRALESLFSTPAK